MSSGQGDSVPAKADDDTEIKSPNEGDKLPEDQVDHASLQGLTEDTSNRTDSGFKDQLPSDFTDKTKSNSDNMDDNSDDDLELKWEDDESDEQSLAPLEKVQETTGHASDLAKPMEADIEDTNLSSTDVIEEKAEVIDENKLLESSPSNNEDTNLSSTLDGPRNNSPLNKNVGNKAISDDVEDTIDENQLLEGPVSDAIDEDKLLEIPDENKEDSFSNDEIIKTDSNCSKSDIQVMAEKSENMVSNLHEGSFLSEIASKTVIDKEITDFNSYDISKESSNNADLDPDSTKLVVNEDITKVIRDFKTVSPIQVKSQVNLSTSCSDDSLMDTTIDINTEHGLKKPDMMLEIPTQEIIELDDTDVSISGTYHENDDDEIEVDNIKDSLKTAPTVDMDEPMEVGTPSLEERADALILQPVNMFRALDTEMSSKEDSYKANKVEDVSEDDWCAIERRLEGFENSFNAESQLNKMSEITEPQSTQQKDDISTKNISSKPNDEKPENTETMPLTEAQKIVIESENKELLRTLQDTSKLDTTDDQISTTMDVDDEALLDPDIQGQISRDTPFESTGADTTTETRLQSDLDKDKEVTPQNNEKEIEVTSDSINQKLEAKKSDNKTDNYDPKPMSPSTPIESMEVEKEIIEKQLESSKSAKVSTTVPSSHIEEITTEPTVTLKVDESTKEKDEEESTDIEQSKQTRVIEPIEVEESTKQSDDEILLSTDQPVKVNSPSKHSVKDKIELETNKPIEDKDNLTSTPEDKIENQPVDILTDDHIETSSSKLTIKDKIIPSTPADIALATSKSADDEKVTAKEPEVKVVELPIASKEVQPSTPLELLPSTSKPDSEVPSTTSDVKVQLEPLPMEVEPSSNEIQPTKPADVLSTQQDNEVITTSKLSEIIDDQLSTSANVVDPSTSKETDDQPSTSTNVVDTSTLKGTDAGQESTSKTSDKIDMKASTSSDMIDVHALTSSISSDKIDMESLTSSDKIDVQASTSSDKIDVQASTLSDKIDVQASTSSDKIDVQASTSSDKIDVQASTSSDKIDVQASTLSDKIDVQASTSSDKIDVQASKLSDKIDVQASTSSDKIDVQASISTEKTDVQASISSEKIDVQASDNIDVQASTSSDKIDVQAPISKDSDEIKVQATTSKVDDIEVQPSTSKTDVEVQPSTSKTDVEVQPSTSKTDVEVQPSTSKTDVEVQPSTSKTDVEVQPSTSKTDIEVKSPREVPLTSVETADPDSDEVPETSDSLGLLAESSRVMEDDEDQDDDDDPDVDGDDDDDYDPEDESSNQMTAEHSEDSNAPPSETDQPKDQDEKETEIESPLEEKGEDEFNFVAEEKDEAIGEEKDDDMEVDGDIVDDIEITSEQIGNEATTDDVELTEPSLVDKEKDTVKLSATSTKEDRVSMLKKLLTTDDKKDKTTKSEAKSASNLGFTQPSHILSIVDLEESSSEDDIQEVKKDTPEDSGTHITFVGYNITIPSSVEVSTVSVDKPPDVAGEKTVDSDEKTEGASVKADSKPSEDKSKPKLSLEIFNLDSDEEDNATAPANENAELPAAEPDKPRGPNKCINIACTSTGKLSYYRADAATVAYYDAGKRKKPLVCDVCADSVVKRAERLVKGIKDLTPLLELDTGKLSSELVEISDSESEDEGDSSDEPKETLGETGASFLEANLAKMINETWNKFCLDSRLTEAQDDLSKEMEKLEAESKEIDAMLTECQVATDKLRNDLYATFEQRRREVSAIVIFDTPLSKYLRVEDVQDNTTSASAPETRAKRRMSSAAETPAKRPAIPLGYAPIDSDTAQVQTQGTKTSIPTVENTKAEDDKDISVLKVSAEAAPADLPPPGELTRPPLRAGACVYAMRNAFGCWIRSRVLEVNGKSAVLGMSQTFTVCRVKYEHKPKGSTKLSPARCLAYADPAPVRLTIGTRIIALFKDAQNPLKKDAFYSGIIAEVPNPVNNYRYLVFFDDGYAQYVQHRDTRVICECSSLVWEEVHPFSREFVKEYLMAYPERPMVRLHAGQSLKTEWNGKWWPSRVIQVDASLVQVHFEEDSRTEWIYRGSTRLAPLFLELQAAERHRARPMPRTKAHPRLNMPYVEYTRSDEQNKSEQTAAQAPPISEREIRQRAVAKKSTALPPPPNIPAPSTDSVTSRVVYYTPKNAVKPYKMTSHSCGPQCKRKDVLALKDLRTYNPLAKPLLSGWERQIVRYKGHKEVMYRAPCGRRLRNMRELHRYLRLVQSDMAVDLFDFTPHTHCLAEFVLNKCLVGKKDLSHGKENVPVPCVNYYDESLPEFCSYNTERTPTAGVPLNLDPEFLCGCDCTDDCEDKSKCACWQMTLEGARTIGLAGPNVGYKYKRLPEPLPSGIYECNSRCKCKHTCLNRVAQHPLQLKLQVFKTLNRGWGIRALNDVPKGSFLCVYAGNLLTDATANMDGLNEGDEYLAELDYIEVVEQMKEGYEEDIPDADKRLDKKNSGKASEESDMSSSEEEDEPSKNEQEDGDFCPGYIGPGVSEFSKRLRKRDKNKKKKAAANEKEKDGEKTGDDCITISDDEEVREPSSFMAQAGMGKEFISKYRSVRSYFGKDEACYIMDAKVQGNIGRYLNHSCQPNVFVQNVFVDTHDPRFPWVAFFALSHIKAGTELTWNYNYDVGSVPGKVLYCYCGAPNCRGRLL